LDSPAIPWQNRTSLTRSCTAIAQGSEEAFQRSLRTVSGTHLQVCVAHERHSATAEDVTQEVFMLLVRNPGNYDRQKGSWLDICWHRTESYAEEAGRTRLDNLSRRKWMEGNDSRAIRTVGDLARVELLECLQKACAGSAGTVREVIVLCDLEEMSYPDAAVVLECPPGTISRGYIEPG